MFNKNLTEEYKNKKMPDDLKNNIFANMQNIKPSVKRNLSVKRRILIYAAVFISLILVVSAAAVVYNNTQYIPFKGFVEGEYEIYRTPEIIQFGDAVIETVMRIQEGDKNELAIVITEEMQIPETQIPIERSNFLDKYGGLSITTLDGNTFVLNDNIYVDVALNGIVLKILFDDFPKVNEFTISGGNISADIKLVEDKFDELYGYAEKDGISIKMMQVAKNSRVFAYEINENILDLDSVFGKNNYTKNIFIGGSLSIYDKAGNHFVETGYLGLTLGFSNNIINDCNLILSKRPVDKITKAVVEKVGIFVNIEETINNGYINPYMILYDFEINFN